MVADGAGELAKALVAYYDQVKPKGSHAETGRLCTRLFIRISVRQCFCPLDSVLSVIIMCLKLPLGISTGLSVCLILGGHMQQGSGWN